VATLVTRNANDAMVEPMVESGTVYIWRNMESGGRLFVEAFERKCDFSRKDITTLIYKNVIHFVFLISSCNKLCHCSTQEGLIPVKLFNGIMATQC
jgi:hypothetical protein